jgi:LPS sulfotransferase NodH
MTSIPDMASLKERWSLPIKKRALNLGLYGQSDYSHFIVLGRSRVGSNLLRGLLNAHPHIVAFGEIFRDTTSLDWDHTGYFQSNGVRTLVQRDPARFLDAKLFGRYPRSVQAVGFKLFYYHAREGGQASPWPYLLERPDVKVLHLKRRNVLQTHLSRKRAALTDRWVETSGQPRGAEAVHLDYEECLKDFEQTRAWEDEYDRCFSAHPLLKVEYERLADDYRTEIAKVQEFLGVTPQPVTPSTFQQARQPLSTSIANYRELKERFSGTPWQEFFTE